MMDGVYVDTEATDNSGKYGGLKSLKLSDHFIYAPHRFYLCNHNETAKMLCKIIVFKHLKKFKIA